MIRAPIPPKVLAAIKATKRRAAIVEGLRVLWPSLMVFAGIGALGIFIQKLPPASISVITGCAVLAAEFLFVRALVFFRPIDDKQAQHLVETAAGAQELAPLTSSGDRPIGGNSALWAWHQKELDQAATALTKPVNPILTRQDGLRAVALLLAGAICLWQPVAAARALSFDVSPLLGDGDLVMDAWAQPPEYTGLPVVRLSKDQRHVSLPEGSVIHARLDGATGAPVLRVPGAAVSMTRERGQAWDAQAVLNKSGDVKISRLGTRVAWDVKAIKDQAPVLTAAPPIKIDPKGRLDVAFTATDDYGIASAALRITPINTPEGLKGKAVFETPIALEDSGDKESESDGARRVFVDVAQHVLTGLDVNIVLVVRDGLGQETLSAPTRLVLPEVNWTTPLGAALQEQRLLILREARAYRNVPPAFATLFEPHSGLPVRLDLTEPFSGAPEGIVRAQSLLSATLASLRDTGLSEVGVMGMQFARERLVLARDITDAHAVAPILWDLALQAEQSDKSPAQQRIAAARQALEEALKGGASEDQIRDLTQELREAVGERLDELAQEGQGQGQGAGDGGNEVSGGDIDKMLRELEQSGGSGARQDALDQLDKLAELMENLQAGQQGQGDGMPRPGSQSSGQAGGANPLDDAMRTQRDLSDETAQRRDEGQEEPTPDLAQRQEDLADQLAPPGGTTRPPTGPQAQAEASKQQAAQAMREAARALREGDLSAAQEAQARAEQALQQAAGAQAAQNGGSDGNQDPLGRNLPRLDDGRGTKVPDQIEKRRARDVREELRRRQADPNRDGQERDYLDRLLKDR